MLKFEGSHPLRWINFFTVFFFFLNQKLSEKTIPHWTGFLEPRQVRPLDPSGSDPSAGDGRAKQGGVRNVAHLGKLGDRIGDLWVRGRAKRDHAGCVGDPRGLHLGFVIDSGGGSVVKRGSWGKD